MKTKLNIIFSWGTCFNKTKMIKSNTDFENLLSEFSEVTEKTYYAHDNGFDSFESSSVVIDRMVSMWISLEKI
jgi:hypothetical protein